jgi:hypothetical protein
MVSNLGDLYKDQGELRDANTMYRRVLVSFERALGSDHELTLGLSTKFEKSIEGSGQAWRYGDDASESSSGLQENIMAQSHVDTGDRQQLENLSKEQGKLDDAGTMYLENSREF